MKKLLLLAIPALIVGVIIAGYSYARINNPTDTTSFLSAAIISLNGSTSSTQTFATSGPALSISTLNGVHTLSLPTSTASQTGVLNSVDFTKFNTNDIALSIVNATTTSAVAQKKFYQAATITDISCSTNGANITIGADERTSTTPDSAGTDVFNGGSLVCDSNENSTSTFANATIAANALLNFDLDTLSNSTTTLRIHIKYTLD